MKTYGLRPSQTLASLTTDADGAFVPPLADGITAIPLVKIAPPSVTTAQVAEPVLVWFADRVERRWIVRDKTTAETTKSWPSKAEFWAEFTATEKLAILDSTIPQIRMLDKELTMWSGSVISTDARITGGMSALVTVGILTEARKAAILTD